MAAPSFGIGVALALAAAAAEVSVVPASAPLIRPEGPRNDPSKTRTKTKARQRARASRQLYPIRSSIPAEHFSPNGVMDASPLWRSSTDSECTRPVHFGRTDSLSAYAFCPSELPQSR